MITYKTRGGEEEGGEREWRRIGERREQGGEGGGGKEGGGKEGERGREDGKPAPPSAFTHTHTRMTLTCVRYC